MTQDWQGPINQILYGLIFTEEITQEIIEWNADDALNRTTLILGPETYYEAIGLALASSEKLDSLHQLPQFDQAQVATFLRAVAARLDELRPWTEPKFIHINDPAVWATLGNAAPIAKLNASLVEITNIVHRTFRPVGDTQPEQEILALKLISGETVAILGKYGDDEMTLSTDELGNADKVIESFSAATGFPTEKIVRVTQ